MIPFNLPSLEGNEMSYVEEAVHGGHSSAKGPFTERVVELLTEELNCADIMLTTSCTAALELAAILLDLEPGDTVIVPSFTFVTSALAFVREGAQVIFADIEEQTLGIDPAHVAELIDDSVRAVVAVHYGGVGCDLDGLASVLEHAPRIDLIEDNAHGLFGRNDGKPLGTFGRMGALSFHETKNFTCGEGGALLINRSDDVERAHILCDKGTNRREFLLGQVDKYSWVDRGSSFGMADILAAYLLGQLEKRDEVLAKREMVWQTYRQLLEPHAERLGFRLPVIPADRDQAFHMFYVVMPDEPTRNRVLSTLRTHDVTATFHYVPLHLSPMGQKVAARTTECPVTTCISGRLLRLPFYNNLDHVDVERVCSQFLTALEAAV